MLCFGLALTIVKFSMVQLDRASNGLEPVVVAKFPIKKYTDDSFLTAEDAQYVLSLFGELLTVLVFMCFSQILV